MSYKFRFNKKLQKYQRLHRMVFEQQLGRQLSPREVVHHKNGNPQDNRPENLLLLQNQSQHMLLEWFERRVARGVQHLYDLDTWLSAHRRIAD